MAIGFGDVKETENRDELETKIRLVNSFLLYMCLLDSRYDRYRSLNVVSGGRQKPTYPYTPSYLQHLPTATEVSLNTYGLRLQSGYLMTCSSAYLHLNCTISYLCKYINRVSGGRPKESSMDILGLVTLPSDADQRSYQIILQRIRLNSFSIPKGTELTNSRDKN